MQQQNQGDVNNVYFSHKQNRHKQKLSNQQLIFLFVQSYDLDSIVCPWHKKFIVFTKPHFKFGPILLKGG